MNNKKRNIVIAIMVAMFLGAVEGTVVTTAIPTIAKELNGFELISWVFSIYLLTSALSTPIYGKLSDLYGRKNILSIGIITFLIGSSLCGLSQNMNQLIAFRALQGLGAGAIFTVTYTIIGDVFDLAERAKVQGWVGTVWGIASLAGPFLGGFFIDYLTWNWIFFINIPFGILSIFLLQKNLQENFIMKKHKIDYMGTILLSSAIVALLLGVLTSGRSANLYSISVMIPLVLAFILLIVFYFVEKKVVEPIVPFEIFTKTSIVVNIISFLVSAVLIGAEVYMAIYIQNVLGYGATISGLTMAPMSVSWLISAVIVSKAIPKYGEKTVVIISSFIMVLCAFFFLTFTTTSSLVYVIIFITLLGFGFGGGLTTLTIIVQSTVDYSKRGAATASNALVRTLGQTIAVSVFGSLLNINIVKYFNALGVVGVDPDNLYSTSNNSISLSIDQIKGAVSSGIHTIFLVLFAMAILFTALSFALRNDLKDA